MANDKSKPIRLAPQSEENTEDLVPKTTNSPAVSARIRYRHKMLLFSFFLMVLTPATIVFWYLEYRSADQFSSTLGFTVRQAENTTAAVDLIGGITSLGGNNSTNTDILFQYIKSQQLVGLIDAELNLTAMYSKPANDPVFSYNPNGTIEDLTNYWGRMVKIYYDNKTGLIELLVLAFEADDANAISQEIVRQSSLMINQLNGIAHADATDHARDVLDQSIDRLKRARTALTEFQTTNQMVDPNADYQGQMGLLNSMQQRMADALIELDLLLDVTNDGDPRVQQAQRKIDVIAARISEERYKLVITDGSGIEFSSLVGEFEALRVDLEFAEQSYISALSSYNNAVAEARRKSTYLAAYVEPTIAQRSEYPNRSAILGLTTLFLFLIWSVMILIAYSIRDRR